MAMKFDSDEDRRAYDRRRMAEWRRSNPDKVKAASSKNAKREKENRRKARQLDEAMGQPVGIKVGRRYRGNHPVGKPWFEVMGVVQGTEGVFWSAYMAQGRHAGQGARPGWFDIRLCVHGWRARKANFWLGWNGERFAVNHHLRILQEHEPKLLESLGHYLRPPEGRPSAIERFLQGTLDVAIGDTLQDEQGEGQ